MQEIGDITLTLTTPDDLKPLATQEASRIAARLNLIEKAINDLKTPKCEWSIKKFWNVHAKFDIMKCLKIELLGIF